MSRRYDTPITVPIPLLADILREERRRISAWRVAALFALFAATLVAAAVIDIAGGGPPAKAAAAGR